MDARNRQLLHVCDRLPALRICAVPDRPFFLASDIRSLWNHQDHLSHVLPGLSPVRLEALWTESLLFITFLVHIEVPPSLYTHLTRLLFPDGDTPCYRDVDMPYAVDRLKALGLTRSKFSRWEEQHLFTPAKIVLNSPTRWVQNIPNGLTRIPFVECDPREEHGGYGDVKFFKLAPEYVVDKDPNPRPVVPDHQRQPVVVAVKSFIDSRADALLNGRAEAANMRLLQHGQASSHSISLASAVIEHGSPPRLLIFYPRAELGDLGQFLRGGKRDDGARLQQYDFRERFPRAVQGWGADAGSNLAMALLQQCAKLTGALRFLHEGFPGIEPGRWVRCAHMDLKPDNVILFGGDGAVGRWKLCDFGISVLKEDEEKGNEREIEARRRLTLNTRARRGGGQYQAPELPENWDPYGEGEAGLAFVGRSSDIWSFGCIFAEVLAFALGGPEGVEEFVAARRQRFRGIGNANFHSPGLGIPTQSTRDFQTTASQTTVSQTKGSIRSSRTQPSSGSSLASGSKCTAASSRTSGHSFAITPTTSVVRPQVLKWLGKKCERRDGEDAQPPVWASCWAGNIRKILQIDPDQRPDASTLQRYVYHVYDDALKYPEEPTHNCEEFHYQAQPSGQQLPEEPLQPPKTPLTSPLTSPLISALLPPPPPISFQVPVSSNALFTGRESIISQIETFFTNPILSQRRLVLTGLGGVGKTQIATAYVYDTYSTGRYKTVLWVFAVDEQELIKSFTELAKTLGLVPRPDATGLDPNLPAMALALLQWLSRADQAPWLLVFDNVDDLDNFDVSRFFPRVPWGDILVTSRRREAHRFGHAIEVEMMSEMEAVQLLTRCSQIEATAGSDDADACAVAEKLGYLPLALDQAGTYVFEQGITFADYMDLYEESHEELLRHKPPRAVWSYEGTVFTTWNMSLAAVAKASSLAAQLLDLAAFFHADGAPLALMCALAQSTSKYEHYHLQDYVDFIRTPADYDQPVGPVPSELLVSKICVSEAIGRLASYSLADSKTMATHPLVHNWLRERQTPAQRIKSGRAAICLTLRALINAYDAPRLAEAERIYPYLFICLDNLHAMPDLLTDTEVQKVGACIIGIDVWAPVSFDHGTLHRADRFYELAAARRHGATWRISDGLLALRRAIRLTSMGRRKECSHHCARFLAAFKQRTRLDRILAGSLAITSALCFFREGDYDGAEWVYEHADHSLDASGVMQARKQLVLGAIKIDRGLPDAAVAILENCAGPLRSGIGKQHFLLSIWHQLMASAYLAQGRPVDAEEYVMAELKGRMSMLEKKNIEFSFSDYELAEVYAQALRAQRRFAEVRTWLGELLGKTASKKPAPARCLAELSLLLVELDEATGQTQGKGRRETVDDLVARAEAKYAEAAAVYELEWNRGMWSFKHFYRTMGEFKERMVS